MNVALHKLYRTSYFLSVGIKADAATERQRAGEDLTASQILSANADLHEREAWEASDRDWNTNDLEGVARIDQNIADDDRTWAAEVTDANVGYSTIHKPPPVDENVDFGVLARRPFASCRSVIPHVGEESFWWWRVWQWFAGFVGVFGFCEWSFRAHEDWHVVVGMLDPPGA